MEPHFVSRRIFGGELTIKALGGRYNSLPFLIRRRGNLVFQPVSETYSLNLNYGNALAYLYTVLNVIAVEIELGEGIIEF